MSQPCLTTSFCHAPPDDVAMRGHDLVEQIIGQRRGADE